MVVTDEHLPELILHGDDGLAKALRRRALAPLDKETLARENVCGRPKADLGKAGSRSEAGLSQPSTAGLMGRSSNPELRERIRRLHRTMRSNL